MLIASFLVALVVALVAMMFVILSNQDKAVEQQRQRRVQAAERDIAEIGRQTRAAIMDEVQRRLRQGRP
jgi:hypothetical protein